MGDEEEVLRCVVMIATRAHGNEPLRKTERAMDISAHRCCYHHDLFGSFLVDSCVEFDRVIVHVGQQCDKLVTSKKSCNFGSLKGGKLVGYLRLGTSFAPFRGAQGYMEEGV